MPTRCRLGITCITIAIYGEYGNVVQSVQVFKQLVSALLVETCRLLNPLPQSHTHGGSVALALGHGLKRAPGGWDVCVYHSKGL